MEQVFHLILRHGRWDCNYCGASYTLEDFEKYDDELKNEKETEVSSQMDEYLCPNCGAVVVTDSNTSATSCVYCGNTTIMKNRLQGEFKPSRIIPFAQAKEVVVDTFYKFSKKKWFAPTEFCKKSNIEKVEGVYIPFWLYNCTSKGTITADAKKITKWVSGLYSYTKVDTFICTRSGQMSYDGVPVDASTKFNDDIMDSIEPYDYESMTTFNPSYLSGFLAEKYDVDVDEAYIRAQNRVKNTTIEELKKDIQGFTSVKVIKDEIEIAKTKDEYVLLPVWILNIKYKDKMHTFAMNGQTGKMVGNVPISAKKLMLTAFFIEILLLIIAIIIGLILY